MSRTLIAVGDARDGWPPAIGPDRSADDYRADWLRSPTADPRRYLAGVDVEAERPRTRVVGGYLERLPLACVRAGLVDYAEKWSYHRAPGRGPAGREQPLFGSRSFHLRDETAPFHSADMLGHLRAFGPPTILCAWGLGVSEEVLRFCRDSTRIYYSIDAPPLRVPPEVSRHFDLILVGAEWQRQRVLAAHPDKPCEILTIGPEFADFETFHPLNVRKDYDLIYVAAAQAYKRHDILFDALAQCSRRVRTLCVAGHGELIDGLRQRARELSIDVDFVGPPGVAFDEVNGLMNRARVGVVCGQDDGCPAILTEYMLAGLPVLANSRLSCGLRFVTPETGMVADPERFHEGVEAILGRAEEFDPRPVTLERHGWPASVRRFGDILRGLGCAAP